MAVKFLSDEWVRAVQDALDSDESIKRAAGSQSARIQQIVTTPEGEKKFWLTLTHGQVRVGTGDSPDSPDATLTQDYDTAAALYRNEMSGMAAYMSGKLKVSGNLMKLMPLQGVLAQVPAALRRVEVEY